MKKYKICEVSGKLIDKDKTIKELIQQHLSNENLYTEEKLEKLNKVIAYIEEKNSLASGSVLSVLKDKGLETISESIINSPRPKNKHLAAEYDIEVLLFYLKQIDPDFFNLLMDNEARNKFEMNKWIVTCFFVIILYFLIKNI